MSAECFALLDDRDASASDRRSRLYTGHAATLSCTHAAQIRTLFEQLQQALRQGKHAIGLFSYELGEQMQGIAPCATPKQLAEILLFDRCDRLSADDVSAWLESREQQDSAKVPAGIAGLLPSIDEEGFHAAIARIQAYLEAGDSYQVNYTYRLHFDAYGPLIALYKKLRASQPVPYGALIALPDGSAVLSSSPELFMRHEQGTLIARPMKGTAAASDTRQDAALAAALANDTKSRAENLMIVDLLRNDLGRIARLGTVKVPALFEVERFGKVLQMTSTIEAAVRDDVSLADIFAALFPCGSVTGAPKRRTMQIIDELEPHPRGIYTGAIGWFDMPRSGHQLGDFCLSVPIRTLALQAPKNGMRYGEMGVGAGIVHDSKAADEYAECRLKAKFLTGLPQQFELLETMHATHHGCRYLNRHPQRLQASAQYFGFVWDEAAIRCRIAETCAGLPATGEYRLRLALHANGECTIQTGLLTALHEPVKLLLSDRPMRSDDLFLRHKTTVRAAYDAAWKMAETQGAFDMLFFNEHGEVTEGARSNLLIKLRGQWLTPPLSAGVLPGVMRSVLLDDPSRNIREARISRDDLLSAEEVWICNALRGALQAHIIHGAA